MKRLKQKASLDYLKPFIVVIIVLGFNTAYPSYQPWSTRVTGQGLLGKSQIGGFIDSMQPLIGNAEKLWFLDGTILGGSRDLNSSNSAYSIGTGVRELKNWSYGEAILGGFFFADYQQTAHRTQAWIANPGIELLGSYNEVRVQGYIPISRRHQTYHYLMASEIPQSTLNEKETYHICEGNWYYVDRNFVSELSEYLDSFYADTTLPDYNHKNEGEFNKHCADMFNNCLCLDRSNISPKGQRQVEPCDIVEAQNNRVIILHHVKRSTDSATLSHLFNQGLNSIRLLRDDSETFENFSKLINNKLQPQIEINYSVHQEFKIIYQIITHKDKIKKSLNLPLFSRISLKRAIKELRRMRVDVEFCFVNDITPPSSGKKKNKQSRKLAKSESYTRH
ncbi:hypothetical protein Lpar_3147 [Legionella parisiensis]|nr:hypothetical protein Lpar_3147 [Legionella parisiensis]STX75843.1 sporadically distributed protein [Legionella parisiensis]